MNSQKSRNGLNATVLEGIFNSLETAVIYYDECGNLAGANAMAMRLLPDLSLHLSNVKDFIKFIYEYSTESDKNSHWMSSLKSEINGTVFFEIIELIDERYFLVRTVEQDDGGTIVEMSDISIIKNNEEYLHHLSNSNEILIEAIQMSQKGIFVAENYGSKRIIFANKALDGLLDRSEAAPLVGYSVEALLSSRFSSEWDKIESVIHTHQKGNFWKKFHKDSQDTKWLSLNLSAEKYCSNHGLIIGFISDETQNKLQENHLRQTQKLEAIGKLAGGVAHDFNNILSIVDGYIRLSESAMGRGENVAENFSRIKQAVARGSGLTKQLLMFGKHRVTESKIVDLCGQVKDMESLLQPLLGVNVMLCIKTGSNSLPVQASTDIISQIVMNLVLNARDAMLDGGEIEVSVFNARQENDEFAVLKVEDSGTGMPPEIIEKIFDPFFTTKEQGKGTGLGLSMVYGLIQQIGASIEVSSQVGEGTTFTIKIPIIQNAELGDISQLDTVHDNGLSGKTILVAEDEPDLLAIMELTLKDFDMKVLRARNGNEALEVQDEYEGKIDFLLTDMVMPELGGLKLAELMKEVRPETSIVFMSGYPVRGEIANVNLPADAIFMAKPVKPNFLRDVLEEVAAGHDVHKINATMWQS